MNQGLIDAFNRYRERRNAAYEQAREQWNERLPFEDIKLFPIDAAALNFWRMVWRNEESHVDGGFDWRSAVSNIQNKPKRYELAIWSGPLLCGLAIGEPTHGDQAVTIKLLERWYSSENPLRGYIAPIAIDVANFYAILLNKRLIKLKNPRTGAIPHYKKLGFVLDSATKHGTYYTKPVYGVRDESKS